MRSSVAFAALVLAALPTEASACQVPTLSAEFTGADAVVEGSFRRTGPLAGVVVPTRVRKGEGLNRYVVTWERVPEEGEDDGVACPTWFPLRKRERGTFYLMRRPDGRFRVTAQDGRRP
jgi:hypothetical protein